MPKRFTLKLDLFGRVFVTPKWLSDGMWLVKRSRLSSRVFREGTPDEIKHQLRNAKWFERLEEFTDAHLERVIPQEPGKTWLFDKDTDKVAIFKSVSAEGPVEEAYFNKRYCDAFRLREVPLYGKSPLHPFTAHSNDVIVMPRKQ
jgi:hypothetical protein